MASLGSIDRQFVLGSAALRAITWAWLVIVTAVSYRDLDHPAVAWALVGAAGLVTLVHGAAARGDLRRSITPWLLTAEAGVAAALLGADRYVYDDGRSQALGGAFPLAVLVLVSAIHGVRWGLAVAALFGLARAVSEGGESISSAFTAARGLSVISSAVLFGVAAVVTSLVARRIRAAEDSAAMARAREEVARDLHDGMLQTLAVVQRRSDDADLVHLARVQEAELRSYLFDPVDDPTRDLETGLRRVAATVTSRHGVRIEVAIVPPLPHLSADAIQAIAGAAGEAMTNAAKHAGVDQVLLFADADDAVVRVAVRDRGDGFDVDDEPRRGLVHSVVHRIESVGGRVTITSTRGSGTEIELEVPIRLESSR